MICPGCGEEGRVCSSALHGGACNRLVPYNVTVEVRIEAASAEDAVNKVREALTLADRGHELYEMSGAWGITKSVRMRT